MNWHDLLVYCHVARNTSICMSPYLQKRATFPKMARRPHLTALFPKLLSSLRCIADFEQKSFPEFVPNLHQALNLCLKEVKFSISWLPSHDMLPGSSGRVIVLVTENSFFVTPCRVSAIKRRLSKPGGS